MRFTITCTINPGWNRCLKEDPVSGSLHHLWESFSWDKYLGLNREGYHGKEIQLVAALLDVFYEHNEKIKVGVPRTGIHGIKNAWSGIYYSTCAEIEKYFDTEFFFYKWPNGCVKD